MKKLILIIAILYSFFGCSKSEDVSYEDLFQGHWSLTSAKTERLMDYDNDGQLFNDIMSDFSCFIFELVINDDGSFSEIRIEKIIHNTIVVCSPQITLEGTWLIKDTTIEFNYNNSIYESELNNFTFLNNDNSFIIKRKFEDLSGEFITNLRFSKLNH